MAHTHPVTDTIDDGRFVIDPITRTLRTESKKITLIKGDHNSERFTFELPDVVEGHDMEKCNRVEVHYINIDSQTRQKSDGVYEVTDFKRDPEHKIVTFSWLISKEVTTYTGSLSFGIRFACTTDTTNEKGEPETRLDYAWSTGIYSGVSIADSIYNGESEIEEYSDILQTWWNRIQSASNSIYAITDEGQFLDLTSKLGSVDADVTNLKPRVATAESNITNLKPRVATAESEIDTLQSQVSTAQSDINTLKNNMSTSQSDITNLKPRVTTAESEIDTLQTDMSEAQSDIINLGAVVGATETEGLRKRVGDLETITNYVKPKVDNLEEDIDTLQSNIGTVNGYISALESANNTNANRIKTLEEYDLNDRINGVDGRVTILENQEHFYPIGTVFTTTKEGALPGSSDWKWAQYESQNIKGAKSRVLSITTGSISSSTTAQDGSSITYYFNSDTYTSGDNHPIGLGKDNVQYVHYSGTQHALMEPKITYNKTTGVLTVVVYSIKANTEIQFQLSYDSTVYVYERVG